MGMAKFDQPKRPTRVRWMRKMLKKGYSPTQIGKSLGITRQAVHQYLLRWENWGLQDPPNDIK